MEIFNVCKKDKVSRYITATLLSKINNMQKIKFS